MKGSSLEAGSEVKLGVRVKGGRKGRRRVRLAPHAKHDPVLDFISKRWYKMQSSCAVVVLSYVVKRAKSKPVITKFSFCQFRRVDVSPLTTAATMQRNAVAGANRASTDDGGSCVFLKD